MLNNQYNYFMYCRVCGLRQPEAPWGEEGDCPSYDICSCCGTEFGYGDCQISAIKNSRKKWLENGAKWRILKDCPPNWNLIEQLNNIPSQFL